MCQTSLFLVSFLTVSIVSAQKVEVFEKADRPEFQDWGKNTQMAEGYGYVKLNVGDTLKGTLKVEKKNNVVTSYVIKSKKQKLNFTAGAIASYGFYPYRVFYYDPQLPGNPKFHPGYVITLSGLKVMGKVAIMNALGTEWKFFPKRIYFIPDKAEIASSIGGGELLEVGQISKDKLDIYDAFGDGYLQRIVTGTLRLSYNPNPKLITKPLYYNPSSTTDSAQIKLKLKSINKSIEDGAPLHDAIRSSGKDTPVSAAISVNTEILEKDYFLTDTRSGRIYMIRQETYWSILEPLYQDCFNAVDPPSKRREDLLNYKKIEESVLWFNSNCK